MKLISPILSITGSDNTGRAGIQADTRTISDLGGYPLTAVASVTVQDSKGIQEILDLPKNMVLGQVKAIYNDNLPKAVKVGMVRDPETIYALRSEIVGCKHVVLVPGILNSYGRRLMSDEAIEAWKKALIPGATILLIRCNEAEIMLRHSIASDDEMVHAAEELIDMGAEHVLLRGGHQMEGQLTALFYGNGQKRFFTSQNTEGWQRHGVGGALSTAIATRLGLGDSISDAISNAHGYIHSRVVYSISTNTGSQRIADIYNQLMTLIARHYREAHDVAFYADRLAITTRYLSQVTSQVVGKSPKQIIAEYIMKESVALLATSRLTVGEISGKLGFSSQAMFSKFFSTHENCSPIEYRNRL